MFRIIQALKFLKNANVQTMILMCSDDIIETNVLGFASVSARDIVSIYHLPIMQRDGPVIGLY